MPLVSVIVPSHNRFDYVSKLVGSIPSCPDIEVILVDDHSTEDLSKVKLTKFYKFQYIGNHSDFRYAGSARNIGIESSSGEYVFFADSDDIIVPEGLLRCVELLTLKRPDILFAKSNSFRDEDGSPGTRHIRNNWLIDRVQKGDDCSILARFGGPVAKFIRRDFIDRHHIRFETQRVSNDIVFSALLLVKRPVVKVSDEVVYSIRQGNVALTNDFSVECTEERLKALLRYNKVLTNGGLRYLMAPALPLLNRLAWTSPRRLLYWTIVFLLKRQPVLVTWWTLKNGLHRCCSIAKQNHGRINTG